MSVEHNRMALIIRVLFWGGGGGESFNIMYGPRGFAGEKMYPSHVELGDWFTMTCKSPISRSNRFFME